LVDQGPRGFDETGLSWPEAGVECALAGRADQRDDGEHRETPIFGDRGIGHHDTRSRAALLVADQQTGPEVYPWPTPEASVPAGSYLIRIEVYRSGEELHVAHHTEKIFIDRR